MLELQQETESSVPLTHVLHAEELVENQTVTDFGAAAREVNVVQAAALRGSG
jgi:hypothetical protein